MEIHDNFSLKALNSFGIDVSARKYISIAAEEEVVDALKVIDTEKRVLIVGGGCNLLFLNDVDACVVQYRNEKIEKMDEDADNVWVKAAAGIEWDDFVAYCVDNNWSGLENLSLIPGKVGSSAVQNIGAYGVEAKDSIESVEAYNIKNGEKIVFSNAECGFGYRESIFKQERAPVYLITSVVFKLQKKFSANTSYKALTEYLAEHKIAVNIQNIRKAVIDIRSSKLPEHTVLGNAGSFFKNPVVSTEKYAALKEKHPGISAYVLNAHQVKLAAAWLIEKAGWKGYREGDAGVHERQALVLVNYGKASGGDIYRLSERIKEDVMERYGVLLSREVQVVR